MKQLLLIVTALFLSGAKAFCQSKMPLPSTQTIMADDTVKKVMKWKVQNMDLGNVPENTVKSVNFEFTNIGHEPVTITRINTFCGCTVADYPKTPTLPGKTATIKVSYTPGNVGYFSKTISVATDVNELGIILIHGVVVPANYGQ